MFPSDCLNQIRKSFAERERADVGGAWTGPWYLRRGIIRFWAKWERVSLPQSVSCALTVPKPRLSFHQQVNRVFSEIVLLEVPQILGMNLKGWVGRLSGSSHLSLKHLSLNTSLLYTQQRTNSMLLRFYLGISCPLSLSPSRFFLSPTLSHLS